MLILLISYLFTAVILIFLISKMGANINCVGLFDAHKTHNSKLSCACFTVFNKYSLPPLSSAMNLTHLSIFSLDVQAKPNRYFVLLPFVSAELGHPNMDLRPSSLVTWKFFNPQRNFDS